MTEEPNDTIRQSRKRLASKMDFFLKTTTSPPLHGLYFLIPLDDNGGGVLHVFLVPCTVVRLYWVFAGYCTVMYGPRER